MQKIAIASEKGGTGKTTIAYHLAGYAAMEGANALLIDADPQGSLSVQMGLPNNPGLYDVLVRGVDFDDRLFVVPRQRYASNDLPTGRLLLLPGNHETRLISQSDQYSRQSIVDLLEDIEESRRAQIVIIDTSPSPSEFHNAVYMAVDAVFIPTQCEPMGVASLYNTLAHIQNANKMREKAGLPPLRIAGVLPNLHRSRTGVHQVNLENIQQRLASAGIPILAPNEMRIVWSEASTAGKTVFAHCPKDEAAVNMMKLAEQVFRQEALYAKQS